MKKRIVQGIAGLAVIAAGGGWILTMPTTADERAFAGLTPDLERGAYLFDAGGCASCHAAPDASGEAMETLSGGRPFASPFGTFYAPNISPDAAHGIGDWSVTDLASALQHGTGKDGEHLYPALPYTSYVHMTDADVVSLHGYLQTLPASDQASLDHDVPFPFNVRRGLGLWKLAFTTDDWAITDVPPEAETGRYIAEALAHCGECHTPRNAVGALDRDNWLAGAPNPSGRGTIPNITPGGLNWSEADLVAYFKSGFTPEFDTAGGEMAEVVANLSQLPEEDLYSLARYLKNIPAVGGAPAN